jgi:pSer/pThr/pTyr-binding forkhead associated (FHA) protein
MQQFALRFISGKYQGGEFPLRMDREIVIGRSSDLDMVLVEDMVSRKHAKISTSGGQIVISDMGSTNGTFVNGEKVKQLRLKEGDRILVGTSILKLVSVDGVAAQATEAEARQRLDNAGKKGEKDKGKPMTGSIEEIPLPDLLQLLSTSKKSGVLSIRNDRGHGRIYLRKGQIYFAAIDDNFAVKPQKAIYRLLTWPTGSFELEPPDDRQVMEEIAESTESLLMEGVRQLDEVNHLMKDLPALDARLAIPTPLAGRLRDMTPEQLDIFQLVLDHGSMQEVLDNFAGPDLEAYQILLDMLKKEFVVVT